MKIQRAVFCSVLLCTSVCIAQTQEKPFSTTLAGGIHLRSIAGAPFSADVVKEFTRVLADGSQVPAVTHGRMFRDSEGRTRSETEILSAAAEPRHFVTIVDPVRQVSIVLDQQTKTATVTDLPAPPIAPQKVKLEQQAQGNRVSAKALAIAGSEELGTSTIEGFNVRGTRRTQPQEATGNSEQAPRAVVESWFSPALKIELQARIAGPRLGETITKLQNIVAGEPDPMLFEVPADYTIKTLSAAK
jgi:hypothetical protein